MDSRIQPVAANIGVQAAKASWMAPIVGVFLNITANGPTAPTQQRLIIGIACFVIYSVGLVLGAFAMTKVKQHGGRSITVPAIIGITINGVLVFLFSVILFLALLPHS